MDVSQNGGPPATTRMFRDCRRSVRVNSQDYIGILLRKLHMRHSTPLEGIVFVYILGTIILFTDVGQSGTTVSLHSVLFMGIYGWVFPSARPTTLRSRTMLESHSDRKYL